MINNNISETLKIQFNDETHYLDDYNKFRVKFS
jgi:hypothetical protein